MYRLIVSDLDETLLRSNKKVSEKDISSIAALEGVSFSIASGRGFTSLHDALKQIGLYNKKDTFTISLNGGIITENLNDRIMYKEALSYEEALELFHLGLSLGKCIHVYTPYKSYTWDMDEDERNYTRGRIDFIHLEKADISFLINESIMKILFVDPDMNHLRQIRKQLDLEDRFAISYSANRYLEFNPINVDKGKALQKLCNILNIPIEESIAVGDSLNDKKMLEAAGLGIGVANASAEIRDVCDVILQSDNDHSPITEIIERFIKK